jgi:hypothetical protein
MPKSKETAKKTDSNRLNRQAGMYSLAAAAAGVSLLALAQPAVSEVVVTRKTIPIPLAPYNQDTSPKISMANNGIDNFSFVLAAGVSNLGPRELVMIPIGLGEEAGNQVLCGGSFYAKAMALDRGVTIGPAVGPSETFSSYAALIEGTNSSGNGGGFFPRGYWGGNPKNKYLGVRFQLGGKTHYGWIRLTVTLNTKLEKPTLEATITGYAYETVANKPIKAGTAALSTAEAQVPKKIQHKTGPSLGMLAAGAEELTAWRREEPSARQ